MSKSPSTHADGFAAGLVIAVVEDETLIALDLHDILKEAGAAQVLIARDAAGLGEMLKGAKPNLAIVNAGPAEEGAPAAQLLHEAGVPFFFATGATEQKILSRFAVPVVPKPYSANVILDALAITLGRK